LKIIIIPLIKNFYKLRIRVQGGDNVPDSGAVIILGNQKNLISVLAIETVMPRKVYWAVSPSVCRGRLARILFRIFFGCFLLDPGRADTRGFRSAFETLRKSEMLAFYPGVVNQGVALFCLRSGYGLLPVFITQETSTSPFRHININFGPVYNLSEYRRIILNVENVDNIVLQINRSVEKLSG